MQKVRGRFSPGPLSFPPVLYLVTEHSDAIYELVAEPFDFRFWLMMMMRRRRMRRMRMSMMRMRMRMMMMTTTMTMTPSA